MRWAARAGAAIAGFCALSCDASPFEPASVVDTLRVLAVRAEPPVAAPGAHVALDALVVDPRPPGKEMRAVTVAWATCPDVGSTEVVACGEAAGSFTLGGPQFALEVPADARDVLGVVFAACAGTVRFERTPTAPVRCVDESGQDVGRDGFVWGVKRVGVSTALTNANPRISDVLFDGAPWGDDAHAAPTACAGPTADDCPDGSKHTLAIRARNGSVEMTPDGPEDLVAFYYVTAGRVQNEFARAAPDGQFVTTFAAADAGPGAAHAGTTVQAWLVLRDDRGGVDWAMRSLATLAP
jgi:hypothetical protein